MAYCTTPLRHWITTIRDFVASGQLLDLEVALSIGNAFTKVIEALVNHLLTPILGFLFDGINIADLNTKLQSDRWPNKTPATLSYGLFLQELVYFAVIAIILSLLITIINKIHQARRRRQIHLEQLPTRQELILMEQTKLVQVIIQSLKK